MDMFTKDLNTSKDIIKTNIKRLVEKGFIDKKSSKSGKGGFSIFHIKKEVQKTILDDNFAPFKRGTKGEQKGNTNSSSSYIYNNNIYNKTTTKTSLFPFCSPFGDNEGKENEGHEIALRDNWDQINIFPLVDIGFSKKHLLQLQSTELTPEMVQDSINAFAFDLKNNALLDKIKTHPLNYLMGILKSNQPYAAPSNFEDPKVVAMRLYLEQKKRQRDDVKKMEEEIFMMNFEDWKSSLSDDDFLRIVPEKKYQEEPFRSGFLKKYFKENVSKNLNVKG